MIIPNVEKITENLKTEKLGRYIVSVEETDSTNSLAKDLAKVGHEHGTLIICARQTKGRGRCGRAWQSDSTGSLCMSVILRPKCKAELISRYIPAIAVGVVRALYNMGVSARIKWPNDILVNGKKLCGILTESAFCGDVCSYVICGIGVNVNNHFERTDDMYLTEADPAGISDYRLTAISIRDVLGKDTEREYVAAILLNEIEAALSCCDSDDAYRELLEEYAEYSCVLGHNAVLHNGTTCINGFADRLDDMGRIVMITDNGEICVDVGDLSLRTV